jgi:hypothetical protein
VFVRVSPQRAVVRAWPERIAAIAVQTLATVDLTGVVAAGRARQVCSTQLAVAAPTGSSKVRKG